MVTHVHGTHTYTHTDTHTHTSDGHSRKRGTCGQATCTTGYLEVICPVAGPVWSRVASL